MCYEYGTLEQETAVCILCNDCAPFFLPCAVLVARPKATHQPRGKRCGFHCSLTSLPRSGKLLCNEAPCPHKKGLRVCQDRQNHSQPIVFFTNAEYNVFNGCGYCKWAKRFPPTKEIDKDLNKGWPGCCRPPRLGEMDLIDELDWPLVAKRYGLPDRSQLRDRPQRPASLSKAASRSGSSARRGSIEIPKEEKEARNRNSSSPSRRGSPRIADQQQPPTKGSPRRESEELYRGLNSRSPISPPGQSITTSYIVAEERQPGQYHTRPIPRNGQTTVALPASANPADPQTLGRSSTIRKLTKDVPSSSSSSSSSDSATSSSSGDPRSLSDINKDFEGMSLSSTSSNRESITTIMSDGAFTDYLSDESEAELQRQAEARAAQIRRMRAEEAEFTAAKRGLANIDLQTPVQWNPVQPVPYSPNPPVYNPSGYARR